ncbi:MAG: hypothetical protein NDF54_06295 [archaeon GB-1867-035]|nr:hypothetical protein [Candidatus Culexmicrobium profundum]
MTIEDMFKVIVLILSLWYISYDIYAIIMITPSLNIHYIFWIMTRLLPPLAIILLIIKEHNEILIPEDVH